MNLNCLFLRKPIEAFPKTYFIFYCKITSPFFAGSKNYIGLDLIRFEQMIFSPFLTKPVFFPRRKKNPRFSLLFHTRCMLKLIIQYKDVRTTIETSQKPKICFFFLASKWTRIARWWMPEERKYGEKRFWWKYEKKRNQFHSKRCSQLVESNFQIYIIWWEASFCLLKIQKAAWKQLNALCVWPVSGFYRCSFLA